MEAGDRAKARAAAVHAVSLQHESCCGIARVKRGVLGAGDTAWLS